MSLRAEEASHIPESRTVRDCGCGETCQCLGCAQHPANTATTDFVRDTFKWMLSTNNIYYEPREMSSLGDSDTQSQKAAVSAVELSSTPAMSPLAGIDASLGLSAGRNHSLPWYHPSGPDESTGLVYLPASERQAAAGYNQNGQILGFDAGLAYPTVNQINTAFSPTAEAHEMGGPYLSPSSFYLQRVEFAACTDATGACFCGDGCACVGCLTHGGHNGIALDLPMPADEFGQRAGLADTSLAPGHIPLKNEESLWNG